MDYEKLYREANKKVAVRFGSNVAKELFPDLYESKDERIRKALITFFQKFPYGSIGDAGTNVNEAIDWLEKQGEQKPDRKFDGSKLKPSPNPYWMRAPEYQLENGQKQEWSEEDIVAIDCAVEVLNKFLPSLAASIERLKSLRPQNRWKPSDEQLKALKEAVDEHWEPDGLDPLYTLYQDLKKLRED